MREALLAVLLAVAARASADPDPAPKRPSCDEAVAAARGQKKIFLEDVLPFCPELTRQLVWTDGAGKRLAPNRWPTAMQGRFVQLFQLIDADQTDLQLQCPSAGQTASNGSKSWVYFTAGQAFDIWAAHVAHAYELEIRGKVPWSLRGLPADEAAEILSSDRYFVPIVKDDAVKYPDGIEPGRDFQLPARALPGDALICDPRVGERFVRGLTGTSQLNLLGATEQETLVNLTWWFQQNVRRDPAGAGPGGLEFTAPGVLRMSLASRLRASSSADFPKAVVASFDCRSAANLMHDLALSVNIPLLVGNMLTYVPDGAGGPVLGHSGLAFRWTRLDALVAEHAEDLYSSGPVVDSTAPASAAGADAPRDFFSAVWRTPQYWNSHGFNYGRTTGAGFVPTADMNGLFNLRSSYEGLPDAGWQLGYWSQTPADLDAESKTSTYFRQSADADGYDECSWPLFVEQYCGDPSETQEQFLDARRGLDADFPAGAASPWPLKPADFYARASVCAARAGGCAAAQALVSRWASATGSDVLP